MTKPRTAWIALGCLAAPAALGERAAGALPQTATTQDLTQLALSLALVLGLIVGGAWAAKRFQLLGTRNTGSLRIVSSLALGPRDRLLLVETGERRLLLGVSAAGIVTLDADDAPGRRARAGSAEPFTRQLEQETRRWSAGS